MGKNNGLINHYKNLYKQINQITPEVYAGIALALHRKYRWGFKRISDLFAESQEIWNECIHSDVNMVEMCERETGIEVQAQVRGKQ